jgi:hypothetical protein
MLYHLQKIDKKNPLELSPSPAPSPTGGRGKKHHSLKNIWVMEKWDECLTLGRQFLVRADDQKSFGC